MSSVFARIEKNLSDADYSVERLASDLCTSRGNLHRRLRAISGKTPSQMLKTARMNRACSLLADTELPLCEVAEKTGFCNQAYFTTVFKNTYGVTPGRWRSMKGPVGAKNGVAGGGEGAISAR